MMRMLRALVVDDEPIARRNIGVLLARHDDVQVIGECSGIDAPGIIRREKPELLFLDVQMPEMDGFDVLAAVSPDAVPAVIFVTAYDQHALRAFEFHALDYLLKPFDDERFDQALERARRRLSKPGDDTADRLLSLLENGATLPSPFPRRIAIREPDRTVFVRVEDIDWIEAADYYVCLHCGGKNHILRQSLNQLEQRLDPARFFRVHRSALVNLDRVRELQPLFKGSFTAILADGTAIRVSRNRWEELQRRLES